jgi:hypothetical protein
MTTTQILTTYEALRAAVPDIDPAKAFSVATAIHNPPTQDFRMPSPLEKLDQVVAATVAAKPLRRRHFIQPKMKWTSRTKRFVREAYAAGRQPHEIADGLVAQGVKNVTIERVRMMAYALSTNRTPFANEAPMRVNGGMHP